MHSLDVVLVLYAVYVPLLIGLYIVELSAIFRYRKMVGFKSSFYRVFSVLAVVNIAACLDGTFVFRLPLFPLVSGLFTWMNEPSGWLTAAHTLAYYLNCLSEFLGVFLAFNRFTTLFFPSLHDKFWRWAFFIGVFLCIALSFAPTYNLMNDINLFLRIPDESGEHGWYYMLSRSELPEASVFMNMCVVTVVSNALSSFLYVACIYRLCSLSTTRNFVVERNFFLVGFLTLIFSLPHCAAMLYFYLTLSLATDEINTEQMAFVAFQLPWLTDLKQISDASADAAAHECFHSQRNQEDDAGLHEIIAKNVDLCADLLPCMSNSNSRAVGYNWWNATNEEFRPILI